MSLRRSLTLLPFTASIFVALQSVRVPGEQPRACLAASPDLILGNGEDGQKRYGTEIIVDNFQFGQKSEKIGLTSKAKATVAAKSEEVEKVSYPEGDSVDPSGTVSTAGRTVPPASSGGFRICSGKESRRLFARGCRACPPPERNITGAASGDALEPIRATTGKEE